MRWVVRQVLPANWRSSRVKFTVLSATLGNHPAKPSPHSVLACSPSFLIQEWPSVPSVATLPSVSTLWSTTSGPPHLSHARGLHTLTQPPLACPSQPHWRKAVKSVVAQSNYKIQTAHKWVSDMVIWYFNAILSMSVACGWDRMLWHKPEQNPSFSCTLHL